MGSDQSPFPLSSKSQDENRLALTFHSTLLFDFCALYSAIRAVVLLSSHLLISADSYVSFLLRGLKLDGLAYGLCFLHRILLGALPIILLEGYLDFISGYFACLFPLDR